MLGLTSIVESYKFDGWIEEKIIIQKKYYLDKSRKLNNIFWKLAENLCKVYLSIYLFI